MDVKNEHETDSFNSTEAVEGNGANDAGATNVGDKSVDGVDAVDTTDAVATVDEDEAAGEAASIGKVDEVVVVTTVDGNEADTDRAGAKRAIIKKDRLLPLYPSNELDNTEFKKPDTELALKKGAKKCLREDIAKIKFHEHFTPVRPSPYCFRFPPPIYKPSEVEVNTYRAPNTDSLGRSYDCHGDLIPSDDTSSGAGPSDVVTGAANARDDVDSDDDNRIDMKALAEMFTIDRDAFKKPHIHFEPESDTEITDEVLVVRNRKTIKILLRRALKMNGMHENELLFSLDVCALMVQIVLWDNSKKSYVMKMLKAVLNNNLQRMFNIVDAKPARERLRKDRAAALKALSSIQRSQPAE